MLLSSAARGCGHNAGVSRGRRAAPLPRRGGGATPQALMQRGRLAGARTRASGREAGGGDARDNAAALAAASERLRALLLDAELGEAAPLALHHLEACSVGERLILICNTGSLGVLSAVILCWLLGEYDPTGGMALDGETAAAGLLGVACGAPLLACSAAARLPAVRGTFPVLAELHERQACLLCRATAGMSNAQVGIALAALLLPSMLLLLPTSAALVHWAGAFVQAVLLQPFGGLLHVPALRSGALSALLPAALGSCAGSSAAASCFGVRPREREALRAALRRAPAAFLGGSARQPARHARRSAAAGAACAAPSLFASTSALARDALDGVEGAEGVDGGGDDGAAEAAAATADAAAAFRLLCMLWLLSRRRVSRLAHALSCLTCTYLGAVWHIGGGNLAAPVAAALLHAGGEALLGRWAALRPARRARDSLGGAQRR